MKLSKRSWLILIIGIFVIGFVSLGMAYSGQQTEQDKINQELSLVMTRLASYSPNKLASQQEELERQLAQIESEIQSAKTHLNQTFDDVFIDIVITDTLFTTAEASDVKIMAISQSNPTSRALEKVAFIALSLTITVEGDIPDIVDFTINLSQEFPTDLVELISVTIPEATEEQEAGEPMANIGLVIYSYEGD